MSRRASMLMLFLQDRHTRNLVTNTPVSIHFTGRGGTRAGHDHEAIGLENVHTPLSDRLGDTSWPVKETPALRRVVCEQPAERQPDPDEPTSASPSLPCLDWTELLTVQIFLARHSFSLNL
jgi:hypothetical protein